LVLGYWYGKSFNGERWSLVPCPSFSSLFQIPYPRTHSNFLISFLDLPLSWSLIVLAAQLQALQTMIGSIERRLLVQHRANEASKRLESVPGIATIGASAIAATVKDPKAFRSGRDFAAWIGLVPRQDSTEGKQKLGPISKQGDRYLRRILVVGAHSVLRRARQNPEKHPWLAQLLARRPFKVVAIALANKMARIASALLASGGH
jgi:transposase